MSRIDFALLLAAALLVLGLAGVLARRNLLFMLMSIELMLSGAALAFVAAGARWGAAQGQVMFLIVLTVAAAEAAIGLALILRLEQAQGSLDADAARTLRD